MISPVLLVSSCLLNYIWNCLSFSGIKISLVVCSNKKYLGFLLVCSSLYRIRHTVVDPCPFCLTNVDLPTHTDVNIYLLYEKI
jgi:hypothetical protein